MNNLISSTKLGTKARFSATVTAFAISTSNTVVAFASSLDSSITDVQSRFFTNFGGPISKLGLLLVAVGIAGMFLTQDKKREMFKNVAIGGAVAGILFAGGDSCIAKQIVDAVGSVTGDGAGSSKKK